MHAVRERMDWDSGSDERADDMLAEVWQLRLAGIPTVLAGGDTLPLDALIPRYLHHIEADHGVVVHDDRVIALDEAHACTCRMLHWDRGWCNLKRPGALTAFQQVCE